MKTNKKISLIIISLLIFTFIPVNFVVAMDNEEDVSQEIPATENEYIICDDCTDEITVTGPQSRALSALNISFDKQSKTIALANVKAASGANTTSLKSVVSLQRYSSGEYKTVSGKTLTKTSNSNKLQHNPKFSVESNGKYRIKVEITEYAGKTSNSSTHYRVLDNNGY